MKNLPEWMWDVWKSGEFVGNNFPNCRATISRHVLKKRDTYHTVLFDQGGQGTEIPNISRVNIDRRIDSDAASMTMVIKNFTRPFANDNLDRTHTGQVPGSPGVQAPSRRKLKDLGRPGVYTFRRGVAVDSDGNNPWGHNETGWVDMFIPNRVIRTYQGYGTSGANRPEDDSRLTLTGVWIIDQVEFNSAGDIALTCRDLAKLLIEQRLYPPIVPVAKYPLEFCADGTKIAPVQSDNKARSPGSVGLRASSTYWVGNDDICGHHFTDAFDGDLGTWWLSAGSSESNTGAVEWIQSFLGPESFTGVTPIKRIRFYLLGATRVVYISVYGSAMGVEDLPGNNGWMGDEIIPYEPVAGDRDNGADIPYVLRITPPLSNGGRWVEVDLPERVQAQAVRLTFTSMSYTTGPQYGCAGIVPTSLAHALTLDPFPYKAAVAAFEIYDISDQEVPTEGNIGDYTDIIKVLAAWAGFYWPRSGGGFWFIGPSGNRVYTASQQTAMDFAAAFGTSWGVADDVDKTLFNWSDGAATGRVWGDFMYSGAYPVDPWCIEPSFWDNKSVMDGINQIREILGFTFFVDSTGGIQWRPPNIWRTGNYVLGQGYQGGYSVRTVSEKNVLADYGVTLDDSALRSDIIVVSADDPDLHGAYSPGFAAGESEGGTAISDLSLLAGQKRVMLVTEYPFGEAGDDYARAQIDKFAYLISLWIHWTYRKSAFRIPGSPGFEPDDQVRIYERTTSETYVHYIEGMTSSMDLETGTWWMDVSTHWLGNGPSKEWMFQAKDMNPALFAYLKSIGQIDEDIDEHNYPDDWFIYKPPSVPDDPIRVPDDYEDLFPLPPELVWPDPDLSSEIVNPWPTYVDPPTGTGGNLSGGSTFACGNTAKFSYWGTPSTAYGNTFITGTTIAGLYVQVDRRSLDAWAALSEVINASAWDPFEAGGYNHRKIAGSSSWSNHAWGLAVDFDWSNWPQGTQAPVGHPIFGVAQIAQNLRTRATGQLIFRWGGIWSGSTVDPMHFEVCCTPHDLSTGVVGF